jgi:hypothetical protein
MGGFGGIFCLPPTIRYRDMARTLGYEGHIAWAEAMP